MRGGQGVYDLRQGALRVGDHGPGGQYHLDG